MSKITLNMDSDMLTRTANKLTALERRLEAQAGLLEEAAAVIRIMLDESGDCREENCLRCSKSRVWLTRYAEAKAQEKSTA